MLPFGSFLTGIPLIIMAAAYMIYFGVYALNKSKDPEPDIPIQSKIEVVKDSPARTTGNFYYYQGADDNSNAFTPLGNKPAIQKQPVILKYYVPDRELSSDFHYFHFFSRPPPLKTC